MSRVLATVCFMGVVMMSIATLAAAAGQEALRIRSPVSVDIS
jgi:hypothetical protein